MGIYDRDYYRTQPSGMNLPGPRTMVGWIILINVVVFVADGLFTPGDAGGTTINDILACKPSTLVHPWLWWQFLTYGFTHAPMPDYEHILFNMLSLFFLGPPVEQRYGSREFVRFYLAAIVLCGVVGSATGMAQGQWDFPHLIGASGAVVGVVLLFIVNYPRQTLLLFFVIPVPAWLVGVLLVLINLFGQAGYGDQNVAYGVHLVGIAFAGAYFHFGWNLTRLSGSLSLDWLKRRPRLRVHNPDRDKQREDKLGQEVDRILEKIHQQGEASLTRKERQTLEAASREYQKNRRDDS
ncbi:MAG: rhomboid family intramembrane serine protease [Pirellulales bacterium]|nr:rhomboid family intramembrane serine protease [Pirellulales bacterium]